MYTETLPYALDPLKFPFPALAALAGRMPLGGGREVALAALLMARLGTGLLGEPLPPAERAARVAAGKVWLASLALPATTRVPFARCLDATAGSPLQAAGALRAVIAAAGSHLDGGAIQELEQLARRLSTT